MLIMSSLNVDHHFDECVVYGILHSISKVFFGKTKGVFLT